MRLLPLLFVLTSCGSSVFVCGGETEETVWASDVCDGWPDCWNGADERTEFCTTELFYCAQEPEAQAIVPAQVCNDVWNCDDGSDESACR